ncbi:MAG TPA: cupin domain-containing protein [Acidimicrobiia bacterium]|nr:cupin domain-containing protein [Acidimicrobiia bacterium]
MSHTYIPDIAAEVPVPEDGTLSRVLYRDDRVRLVGFAFDVGQELTEHTAAVPVLVQVVTGRFAATVGSDTLTLEPGGWLRMDAHVPHSLRALEPSVMLLTMLPGPRPT